MMKMPKWKQSSSSLSSLSLWSTPWSFAALLPWWKSLVLLVALIIAGLNALLLLYYAKELSERLVRDIQSNNKNYNKSEGGGGAAARVEGVGCYYSNPSPPPSTPHYRAESEIRSEEIFADVTDAATSENYMQPPATGPIVGNQLGFNVSYNARRMLEEEPRLEVIVMPHSHNDPGHTDTFLESYWKAADSILSSAHSYLGSAMGKGVSFGWAEVIFLDIWWQNHNAEEREAFRKIVNSGQVEILTGGWVMADEANTHYFALIMQLLEGHEWVRNHLGVNATPVTHWNIDSFGASPTMPYLMRQAGIHQGVVKRIHSTVKSRMAARRQLQFRWRQAWAGASDATDFLTYVMPMYGTHISYTCGVDPKVCCQFDFHHVGEECFGGWGGRVVAIDQSNVAERAALLADQFWKKAQLFEGNVILVPWGEDQRYISEGEWAAQVDNLRRLFTHINAHPQRYNIHVRFGTAREYFDTLRQQLSTPQQHPANRKDGKMVAMGNGECGGKDKGKEGKHEAAAAGEASLTTLPTLSGDFFPYSAGDNRYWTGYYTSRPFHKQLDRWLQHYLRAADVLYTAAINHHHHHHEPSRSGGVGGGDDGGEVGLLTDELIGAYPQLVVARRALALFQHHDAITATSMERVMHDYGVRLLDAINKSKSIISKATATLLLKTSSSSSSSAQRSTSRMSTYSINSTQTATQGTILGGNTTMQSLFGAQRQRAGRLVSPPPPAPPYSPVPTSPSPHQAIHASKLESDHKFAGFELPQQRVIPVGSQLVLFNSLSFEREEVVCVLVSAPTHFPSKERRRRKGKSHYKLPLIYGTSSERSKKNAGRNSEDGERSSQWKPLPKQQIEPVVEVDDVDKKLALASDKLKLCFLAQFPALSFRSFYLDYPPPNAEETSSPSIAKLRVKGRMHTATPASGTQEFFTDYEQIEDQHGWQNLTLTNDHISLHLDKRTGFLRQLAARRLPAATHPEAATGKKPLKMELSFVKYRPQSYEGIPPKVFAFHPQGPAQPLQNSTGAEGEEGNAYVLIEGPVRKSVVVRLGGPYRLLHAVELDAHSDAPTIRNRLDLSHLRDEEVEVGMRLQSDPRLTDFYTEVNAYQFVRRRRIHGLPLGAQFHPMPGSALIEDKSQRFSLLGRQPLGVASLEPGWMEVMLDRRLTEAPGNALGGMNDSYPTESTFRLLWEKYSADQRSPPNNFSVYDDFQQQQQQQTTAAYHSLEGHRASLRLQYPVILQWRYPRVPSRKQQEGEGTDSQGGELRRRWWSVKRGEAMHIISKALPPDVHLVALRTLSNVTDYDYSASPTTTIAVGTRSNEKAEHSAATQHRSFTSLTTRPRHSAALILHRVGVECRLHSATTRFSQAANPHRAHMPQCSAHNAPTTGSPQEGGGNDRSPAGWGVVKLMSLFSSGGEGQRGGAVVMRRPSRVAEASLTLLRVAGQSERGGNVSELVLRPMEIKSWRLDFFTSSEVDDG